MNGQAILSFKIKIDMIQISVCWGHDWQMIHMKYQILSWKSRKEYDKICCLLHLWLAL